MSNLKTSLTFTSLALALGAIALALTAPSTASADANPLATPEPQRIVLWNEDHCQITDLIGEWRVRSAPRGSRMRPQHDECYIKILSSVDGEEHQYRVGTGGEVYIAHGWIAVNQVHQETWSSAPGGGFSSPGTEPEDCTLEVPKNLVVKLAFEQGACWRSSLEPGLGCEFQWRCLQGAEGCRLEIQMLNGTHDLEGECGSGNMVSQCDSAGSGATLCFRQN